MDGVERLIGDLKGEDAYLRRNAAELLGVIKDKRAVPALIEALKDAQWYVRCRAAKALRRISDASAVPALIGASKDKHSRVREDAVEALVKIRDLSVVPALVEVFVEALKYDEPRNPRRLDTEWELEALEKLMNKCETIEDFEKFEKGIDEGLVALRKRRVDKTILIKAQIYLAKLTRKIAKEKDKLALKRDLLLDYKPKPPKKGRGVYQVSRRIRNG
jgi:hypothetical protein